MDINKKIRESEDPIWNIVFPISKIVCIAAGIIIGYNAGIGCAIVGFMSIPIGGMIIYAGAVVLTLGAIAVVICAIV